MRTARPWLDANFSAAVSGSAWPACPASAHVKMSCPNLGAHDAWLTTTDPQGTLDARVGVAKVTHYPLQQEGFFAPAHRSQQSFCFL